MSTQFLSEVEYSEYYYDIDVRYRLLSAKTVLRLVAWKTELHFALLKYRGIQLILIASCLCQSYKHCVQNVFHRHCDDDGNYNTSTATNELTVHTLAR